MKIAYFLGLQAELFLPEESVLKGWVVDTEKSEPNRHRLGIYSFVIWWRITLVSEVFFRLEEKREKIDKRREIREER